jgi:hypothetical protein
MSLLRRLRGPGAPVLLMVTLAACTPAPPPGHVEYAVRYNMVSELVAPGWYGLAPEGLYLIDGAEVVDTDRSYPLVRKVESMTVAQLQGAVADAVAAVRRGELKPKQAPTG